ncbi:hypothetical protein C8R44DRAFT_790808 [Mycena epipterygia]|nr:hypothetical protein C8R44DRAFT_790808 [Mycena epipterygia]
MSGFFSCPNCLTVLDSACHSKSESPLLTSVSSDILDTNNPPDEIQIPSIRDFISSAGAHRGLLNAKIASLRLSLDKLLKERETLDIEIEKHKGGLSPLRRMPTEIISLIFTFTLPPHVPDAESAPWTVSAVCARWRAIALSQPYFWNSFCIHFPDELVNRFRLETQLHRSGRLPLNVEFHCEDCEIYMEREAEIIDVLARHSVRWETISLSGPKQLYSDLRDRIHHQLPLLRKMWIELYFDDASASLDIFDCAPDLQEVFVNTELWNFPVEMTVPWPQLLKYGVGNTWEGHLAALCSCSNLVDCTIEISDSIPPETLTLTHLPCLLRLTVSHPAFLAYLETPALLELHCNADSVHLPSFLRRLHSKLQKLMLCGDTMTASRLTYIVDAVPTLAYLGLFAPFPAGFVNDLRSRDSRLAPALECLSVCLYDAIDADKLIEALDSPGWQARTPQPSLRLAFDSSCSPDILHRLELLRGRGMDIIVFDTQYSLYCQIVPETLRLDAR